MIDPILHHTLDLEAEVRRLTAENASLRQQLAAMREQVPAFYAVLEDGEIIAADSSKEKLLSRGLGKLGPVTELYAAPVPPTDDVRDAELVAVAREMADELRVYYAVEYPPDTHGFPSVKRKFDLNMELVHKAEAILAAKGDGQ